MVGKGCSKSKKPYGSGLPKLTFLDRAADPEKGKMVYINVCQTCHGDKIYLYTFRSIIPYYKVTLTLITLPPSETG